MNNLLQYLIFQKTVILVFLPVLMYAQEPQLPNRKEAHQINSGHHDGNNLNTSRARLAFQDMIQVDNAKWLRLQFSTHHLGKRADNNEVRSQRYERKMKVDSLQSYVLITSLEDGAQQRLDATTMIQWGNNSAFFNGNAVSIELHVGPGGRDIYFQIDTVIVGERRSKLDTTLRKSITVQTICGNSDDRVSSSDPAVGRTLEVTGGDSTAVCTGWIVSNSANLTAGHCAPTTAFLAVLEFNVPLSDSDGTVNFAHPDDQYAVEASTIIKFDDTFNEFGNDYGLFGTYANSNTGLMPVEAQEAFYRMSIEADPENLRITGFGADDSVYYKTQQTHSGSNEHETVINDVVIYWKYKVDTKGFNSGSPIIVPGTNLTVGIHTDGGCTSSGGTNKGTSFKNIFLEEAIQEFIGANITYADAGHTVTTEDGTVFRPYDTIGEAVTNTAAGDTISVVTGYYNESVTISKAITFNLPVGGITIGASGPSASVHEYNDEKVHEIAEDDLDPSLPSIYALRNAYPNPFNPTTTIRYELPEQANVKLVVYNLLGREVTRLAEGNMPPGYHAAAWNGRDATGREVPTGMYIARLVTKNYTKSIKMVLLK